MRFSVVVLTLVVAAPVVARPGEQQAPASSPAAGKKDGRKDKEKKDGPAAPAKVYTNDDLKDAGKGGGAVTFLAEPEPASADTHAPTTPSQPASGGAAAELGVSTESGGAPAQSSDGDRASAEVGSQTGEQGWRQRVREQREAVTTAEAHLARLEAKLNALTNPQQQPQPIEALQPDPQRRLTKDEDRIQLERDLEAARTGLADARRALEDLLEEARRKGVPPGWVEER